MESFSEQDPVTIFLEEIKQEKYLYFRRQKIVYHEALPDKKEQISSTPIVFIGGYGRKYDAYKKELQNLYFSGRRVIYINPLKGLSENTSQYFPALGKTKSLPEVILAKAREVMALMKYLSTDKIDLVGHSQGAVVASALSGMINDKEKPQVNNLVLVNPAGMYGSEKALDLSKRAIVSARLEQSKSDALIYLNKHLIPDGFQGEHEKKVRQTKIDLANVKNSSDEGKNLLWRIREEIPGLADTDILEVLKEIKLRNKIKTTLLLANSDYLFPPDRIMGHIGVEGDNEHSDRIFQVVDKYAMFANKKATHNALSYEDPGVLRSILNEGLEKKK